jgi:hypothetical protein
MSRYVFDGAVIFDHSTFDRMRFEHIMHDTLKMSLSKFRLVTYPVQND